MTAVVLDVDAWEVVRSAITLVLDVSPSSASDHQVQAATRWAQDLDADSLAMIEIVEVVEDQMRERGALVSIDDDTLAALVTVADLLAALKPVRRSASGEENR